MNKLTNRLINTCKAAGLNIAVVFTTSMLPIMQPAMADIYRCEQDGKTTLQQTPCGDSDREIQRYQSLPAETAAKRKEPSRSYADNVSRDDLPNYSRSNSGNASGRNRDYQSLKTLRECRKLARENEQIADRMRRGYKVAEGERLKRRQRQIKSDLEFYDCR